MVGYTTQEFHTKVKFFSRKIYNAVPTLFHLSSRKPVNVPYTGNFSIMSRDSFLILRQLQLACLTNGALDRFNNTNLKYDNTQIVLSTVSGTQANTSFQMNP